MFSCPTRREGGWKHERCIIKEKRAKIFLAQEEEKQANLQKKLDIIEKIKAMATSPDEANKSYQEFKALQQEWKEIKAVPADKANELTAQLTTCHRAVLRPVEAQQRGSGIRLGEELEAKNALRGC